MSHFPALALLGTLMTCSAGFADDDPIQKKLEAARMTYELEMGKFRKAVGDWFDKREDVARMAGNKKTVDEIKAEREAFDDREELPATVPATVKRLSVTARTKMENALKQGVKEYVQARKDDEAVVVQKELDTLREPRDPAAQIVAKLVVGKWVHDGRFTYVFKKDGTYVLEGTKRSGTFVVSKDAKEVSLRWANENRTEVIMIGPNGWKLVDRPFVPKP